MDTYQLNEQQQRLAETFYNDYSLIKFGAYGEEYLYTVCDVDTRKYHALRERPDYRQFIADKDKYYRQILSNLMALRCNFSADSFIEDK